MNDLKSAAVSLREKGYSYNMISHKLGVPKSTMSYWFKGQPFMPNADTLKRIHEGQKKLGARRRNAKINQIEEQRMVGISEIGTLTTRDLWVLGIGLYIGEGSKSAEITRISNSDPAVIKLMVQWFLNVCGFTADNLSIRLHLYPDNDESECVGYWQKVTGLPIENFRPASFDRRNNKQRTKFRRLPYGTAHITIVSRGDPEKGRKFFRKLRGWMDGVLNQV